MNEEIKSGRPFVFTDPAQLKQEVQTYFDMCDPHLVTKKVVSSHRDDGTAILVDREVMTDQEPYTITGLALHLGVSRRTLLNYRDPDHYSDDIDEEVRQELIHTLEKAAQKVEMFNERQLHKNGLANGIKFNLTNNFGWVDKTVQEQDVRTVKDALDELDDPDEISNEAEKALNETTEEGQAA